MGPRAPTRSDQTGSGAAAELTTEKRDCSEDPDLCILRNELPPLPPPLAHTFVIARPSLLDSRSTAARPPAPHWLKLGELHVHVV